MKLQSKYSVILSLSLAFFGIGCGQQGKDSRSSYQVKTQSFDAVKTKAAIIINLTNPNILLNDKPERPINSYLLTVEPEESCPEDIHSVLGWFTDDRVSVTLWLSSLCNVKTNLQYGIHNSENNNPDSITVSNGLQETYYRNNQPVYLSTGVLSQNKSTNLIFDLVLTKEGQDKGYLEKKVASNAPPAQTADQNTARVSFDQVRSLLASPGKGDCARSGCHNGAGTLKRYLNPEDFKSSETSVLKRVVELQNMPPNPEELTGSERQKIGQWLSGGPSASDPASQEIENEKAGSPDNPEKSESSENNGANSEIETVTFNDIQALLLGPGKGDCARAGCHAEGGSLRPLTSFEEFKNADTGILSRVVNLQNMPPNASELSSEERALIQAWLTDGSLQ